MYYAIQKMLENRKKDYPNCYHNIRNVLSTLVRQLKTNVIIWKVIQLCKVRYLITEKMWNQCLNLLKRVGAPLYCHVSIGISRAVNQIIPCGMKLWILSLRGAVYQSTEQCAAAFHPELAQNYDILCHKGVIGAIISGQWRRIQCEKDANTRYKLYPHLLHSTSSPLSCWQQ